VGTTCQMSLAYSTMVRSLLNLPAAGRVHDGAARPLLLVPAHLPPQAAAGSSGQQEAATHLSPTHPHILQQLMMAAFAGRCSALNQHLLRTPQHRVHSAAVEHAIVLGRPPFTKEQCSTADLCLPLPSYTVVLLHATRVGGVGWGGVPL